MDKKTLIKRTIISSVIIVLVAAVGSIFVAIGMDWFNSLIKPSQWIPNVIIPIVWTVIYLAFAIVNFFWLKKSDIPRDTTIIMLVNGALNVLWCLVFFALKLTFVGNIFIIINLIAGIILWLNIYKTQKLYSYILSIYPIWLSVATTLNLALWILN